jgi:hypothetical protein
MFVTTLMTTEILLSAQCMCKSPFTRVIFCCHFLLLIDLNEWANNECAECALPQLNIRDRFTRSHPSKGESRTTFFQTIQEYCMYVRAP